MDHYKHDNINNTNKIKCTVFLHPVLQPLWHKNLTITLMSKLGICSLCEEPGELFLAAPSGTPIPALGPTWLINELFATASDLLDAQNPKEEISAKLSKCLL